MCWRRARSTPIRQRGAISRSELGVASDRAYGDWREMLAGERGRPDRVDLVTVATPNSTHYEIPRRFSKPASPCCARSR